MLASDFSDGSSAETQTYREGHAHRPMESTLRFRQLNFRARCSKKRLKGRNSPTNPKKPPQGAIK